MGGSKLKIRDGFLLKEVAGDFIVVPVEENLIDFCSIIILNEVAVFLWQQLREDKSKEQLVDAVLNEYDTDRYTASQDVTEFI